MPSTDEVDWELFTSYILLMSSTQEIFSAAIDEAMHMGLIAVADLDEALRMKSHAEQLATIRQHYQAEQCRAAAVEEGDLNGESD